MVEHTTKPGYALLRMKSMDDKIVYFIMDCPRYSFNKEGTFDDEETQQSGDEYKYEEHSCPTNWLGDCVEVICEGQVDEHGIMEFVRSVDAKPDDIDPEWKDIFPEAFTNV